MAGAAAGMTAMFATPVAAVLLAVELLLFEWKPRSLMPVALAGATVAALPRPLPDRTQGPLFPSRHTPSPGPAGPAGCVVVGLLAGLLSLAADPASTAPEDAFQRLPIHWMWWPAIGGLVVGIGGYCRAARAGRRLRHRSATCCTDELTASRSLVASCSSVKAMIWAISLGSGTSGGVLAPLLMMGARWAASSRTFLPGRGRRLLAAGQHGRHPGRHDARAADRHHLRPRADPRLNALLPLLIASAMAYGFTVLMLRRSILTEKIAGAATTSAANTASTRWSG